MKNLTLVSVGFFTMLVASCEKVIDIPLDEADQQIVVEGVFKDQPGNNYLLLSKTGSVYEESNFEKIVGASVTVTDQSNNVYSLTEVSGTPGKYTHPSFQVLPNNFYTLHVITSDQDTLKATCKTFDTPTLDWLEYEEQIGTFGIGSDTSYLVFFSFSDLAEQENFYRIAAWVNGAKDDVYYVTNDDLFNGETLIQPLFATTVEKGDTVFVELQSMDKANYTYFFGLSSGAGAGGPFAATPANPVTNIEGGIGYFGTYTTDTMSIIMPQ